MDKAKSLKININIQKPQDIEPLPTFELMPHDTNDRISKFTNARDKKIDGMDKSSTNLEKYIEAIKIHNIIVDKSTEENIIVDNAKNLENDCEGSQNENSIGDDKCKDENLEEKNTDKKKGEIKPKKKYIRNFYNRCFPNKIIMEFYRMKENGETDGMNALKTMRFYAMTQLQIHKIHYDFICDNFNPTQLKVKGEIHKFKRGGCTSCVQTASGT
ncbi:hypothetical protein LIER_19891 [Lithospermum erythrorhizon]|uniref:Uncharacterized protein n=1 Tax=Lithospermum erythrorhizon TaxID=34254 RepID=A0AAV3QMG7_LITER